MLFESLRLGNVIRAKFVTDPKITPENMIKYIRQLGFSEKVIKQRLVSEVETIFNSKIEVLRKDTTWRKDDRAKASKTLIIRSLVQKKSNYIAALRIILDRK